MKTTKRQVLPTLYVIATPIGHLGDFSPRASKLLGEVDEVLCEDTRSTRKLLAALGIKAPKLTRLDENVSSHVRKKLLERIKEGSKMALVSDAGTPAISDPGATFVQMLRKSGVKVYPVPGVSAVTALLSVSGFQESTFCFRGFFPRKVKEQKTEVTSLSRSRIGRVSVWFESPRRLGKTLEFLLDTVPNVEMILAKEMTKKFENYYYGTVASVYEAFASTKSEERAGEWCFALCFSAIEQPFVEEYSEELNWEKALLCLINVKTKPSEAAKVVSQEFGVAKNLVYDKALQLCRKNIS